MYFLGGFFHVFKSNMNEEINVTWPREKCKFFDIHVDDKKDYFKEIEKISENLLSNPVIENFKIIKKN